MGIYTYTAILLGSYLVPFIYMFTHRRFLIRDYKLYVLNPTVLIAALPFIIWDIYATAIGHWQFNPQYTLPHKFAGLPIEEYVFFLIIPQNCLLVWVAMKHYTGGHSIKADFRKHLERFGL
jgi:lycopene cyclase domain-containing protein